MRGKSLKTWCEENNKLELLDEWNYEKNGDLTPENITKGSNRQVWWKCKNCNTEYTKKPYLRTIGNGRNCPNCGLLMRLKDKQSLRTKKRADLKSWCEDNNKKYILDEWDNIKNYPITPENIGAFSNKKFWWRGSCGHEWQAVISSRTHMNSGCPYCNKQGTSFAEQSVYYYIKQLYPDTVNGDKHLNVELDIYIPSKMIAIEYDGDVWHKKNKRVDYDRQKNEICKKNNIELIRIREPRLSDLDGCKIFRRYDSVSSESLNDVIISVLKYLDAKSKIDVDVERDTNEIYKAFGSHIKKQSLADAFPDVASEWDYNKNNNITPDMIHGGARKAYWWICKKCGKSWKASVSTRTRLNTGCPICNHMGYGKRVRNIETGDVFDTIRDAAKWCGGNNSNILNCCKGNYKSSYGYHWEYVD